MIESTIIDYQAPFDQGLNIQTEQILGVYRKAKSVSGPPGYNALCLKIILVSKRPLFWNEYFTYTWAIRSPGHASADMLVSVIHSGFRDTAHSLQLLFVHWWRGSSLETYWRLSTFSRNNEYILSFPICNMIDCGSSPHRDDLSKL